MAAPARLSQTLAALLAGASLLPAAGCNNSNYSPTILSPTAPFSQTDVRVGTGAEAVAGKRLTLNYTGWFYDPSGAEQKGQQFGTSVGGTPLSFTLGAGQLIRGLEMGLPGMKVGGLRRLIIPPDLAYGSTGSQGGQIPPNATLVFDVELLDVQ